jgi:ribosomal protein S18 acetylase RimI-like enzyme
VRLTTASGAAWPIESIKERAVTDVDFDALWRLHVDAMQTYVAATYGPWVDAVQMAMFRERWPRNQGQRVLVDEAAVVAASLLERRADDVYLAFVEVASSHQRRGLGTAIVRRALAAAAAACVPARLQVMKANPDARRLYQRVGFSIEGETPTHYLMLARPPAL